MNKQQIYNELKRMVKAEEITDREHGLALRRGSGEAWKIAVSNIESIPAPKITKRKKRTYPPPNTRPPTIKPLPPVIAQKISPTEAIVITRPHTRRAEYYYYFHIGGTQE